MIRVGSVPALPAGTRLLAGVAAAPSLDLTIALTPRDATALADYARAVSDPSSTDYRHYLTPRQFRARFAPSAAAVAAVTRALRRQGLRVGRLSANGLSLHVRGSGGAVERAFALSLARVRLPDGADALVDTAAPALAARIAPSVQAVIGLDGLPRMHALSVRRQTAAPPSPAHARVLATVSPHFKTGGPQPCLRAQQIAPGQGAYTADQVATAYGFSGVYRGGDLGQGVTIAAYELEPNAPGDIAAYQRCYGTHASVGYVKVDGGAGSGLGNGEAALDIEQLIGLAPKAKILVYQGPNNNSDNPGSGPYDTLAAIVSQDRAQVISNSWGECEKLEGTSDARAEATLLQEAAVQGQTFVSAAGDTGSEDCYAPPPGGNTNNSLAVDDPGSQPFAVSVGGTAMTSIGPPPVETVWNDDNPSIDYARFGIQPGAGGGGISTLWSMPAYQSTVPAALGVIGTASSPAPCGTAAGSYCREVPDVSADADPMTPYLDYWNGAGVKDRAESGWQGTGGTSGAAPVWAALFALADASPACDGTLVGFPNAELYQLAGESQSTYFNDVTVGNNDFTPSGNHSGQYPAGPGYDLASGLGTPKAAALVPALCRQAVQVGHVAAVRSFYGQRVRLSLTATLPAGQSGGVSFRSRYLPLGLHLNQRTGVISGRLKAAGVRRVLVTAATPSGARGTVRFDWTVQRRPRLTLAVSSLGGAVSTMTLTISSGQYEPGVRNLQIRLPSGITALHPGDVSVTTLSGRRLGHTATVRGRVLTIKLRAPHSPLQVVIPRGAMRLTRLPAGPLSVKITDRLGGETTLPRTL